MILDYKWVVQGLIRAGMPILEAVNLMRNEIEGYDLKGWTLLADIIIKNKIHEHYINFLEELINSDGFVLNARRVEELIDTALSTQEYRWGELVATVIDKCMTDEMREQIDNNRFAKLRDFLAVCEGITSEDIEGDVPVNV